MFLKYDDLQVGTKIVPVFDYMTGDLEVIRSAVDHAFRAAALAFVGSDTTLAVQRCQESRLPERSFLAIRKDNAYSGVQHFTHIEILQTLTANDQEVAKLFIDLGKSFLSTRWEKWVESRPAAGDDELEFVLEKLQWAFAQEGYVQQMGTVLTNSIGASIYAHHFPARSPIAIRLASYCRVAKKSPTASEQMLALWSEARSSDKAKFLAMAGVRVEDPRTQL
jgi:hypothetical protein